MLNDVRFAVRSFLKNPEFALACIVTLGLGIGANTAIFSVVYTLLLKALPYQNPESLVVVWEHNIPRDRKNNVVSPGNFIPWRELQRSFEDLAAVGMTLKTTITGGGEPEDVPLQLVSPSFFPLLGVPPALGRPFSAEEDRPDNRVAVISDRLWKRRFAADPNILGRAITLNGMSNSVAASCLRASPTWTRP